MEQDYIKTIREACWKANPKRWENPDNYEPHRMGWDVRLADVLAAIAGTYAALDAGEPWVIDAAGQIYDLREQESLTFLHKVKATWNLRKDRLEDQSIECLKFLADRLSSLYQ